MTNSYRFRPRIAAILFCFLPLFLGNLTLPGRIAAQTTDRTADQTTGSSDIAPTVLATTSWTAAFARLAGAGRVDLLAPYEMLHPPEYELRPADLRRIEDADLVVYAGYESMMDRLRQVLGDAAVDSIRITTTNTPQVIQEETLRIAGALGTELEANLNLVEIVDFFDDWRVEIRRLGLHDRPVITHAFQAQLLRDLGIEVAGTFGPGPLEAQQIARLTREGADTAVIIDNQHNQVAQPLRETLPGVPVVSFINFPGHQGTRTLPDVLRFNRETLYRALR